MLAGTSGPGGGAIWDVTPATGAYGDTAPQVPIATIAAQVPGQRRPGLTGGDHHACYPRTAT